MRFALGPRMRKIVRYVGFALLALVTFIFAFQLTFPFNRVKDKVVEVLSPSYEVTIGDVERSLIPGKMYFKAVSLRTRPTSKDEVASTLYIEQLDVGIGLFALLRGTASVKLDAKIGPGHLKGNIAINSGGTEVDLVGDDLPSGSLPMREVLGLPMSGKLKLAVDLDLPNNKAGKPGPNWVKAEGHIELACPSGCTIGDGKSKLKPKLRIKAQQAFAEGGIDFGKVTVDSLLAAVDIKNGKLTVSKFDAKSGDGDLKVEFDVALNNDLMSSNVTGCLRFRGSDGLLKREPKTHAAISTTGAPVGPDNLFHIKLDGQLREIRRLGVVCTSGAGSVNMDNPGATARPNLTVTPETPPPTPIPTPSPNPAIHPPGTPPVLPPTPPPGSAFPPKLPTTNLPPPAAPPPAGSAVPHVPPATPDGEPIQTPNVNVPPPAAPPSDPSITPTNPNAPP